MAHVCDKDCHRIKNLLSQGSKNGVWENVILGYDAKLSLAAQRCDDVEVRQIGNKKLLILHESGYSSPPAVTPRSPDVRLTPTVSASPSNLPSPTAAPHRPAPARQSLRRVEVCWVESANLFYVHEVEAVPNYLPQIEETLRYLKGAQTPMLESEMVIGAAGIVPSRDVGFDQGEGWVRVEIKRVDSDGVLVFLMDHGTTTKLTGRRVCFLDGGEGGGVCSNL